MEQLHYIYKITNLVNQKLYIGQTVNPQDRWRDHTREARKEQPSMIVHHAMKKHGIDNFTFEVIETCDSQDEANYQEEWHIKISCSHVSTDGGYNVSLGGSVAPKTDEWKQALAENVKQKIANGTWHGAANSPYVKGHQPSEATRAKISASNKGKPAHNKLFTDEQIIELKHQYYDLGMSSRQLAKIYGVAKSAIMSNVREEGRKMHPPTHNGRKVHSEEEKAKRAISMARYRASKGLADQTPAEA